jgi:hypothetical protein
LNANEIVTRLCAVVNDAALMFAHEPDEVFIKALKPMRVDLRSEFGELIQQIPEATSLIEEVVKCTAIQRHDIELGAGLPAPAGTMALNSNSCNSSERQSHFRQRKVNCMRVMRQVGVPPTALGASGSRHVRN